MDEFVSGPMLIPAHNLSRQRGAALLLMLLVIIVAASASLLSRVDPASLKARRAAGSQAALADAKRALLAFAATYPDRVPGSPAQLPCPDLDSGGGFLDGEAHTSSCGAAGVTMLGRLPWRTLGLDAPRDSAGSCLWYAVSGAHKSAGASTATMINPDTNGLLQVFSLDSGAALYGATPDNRAVAVIFAPREPVVGQTRLVPAVDGGCSATFSANDYLEASVALGISNAVVTGAPLVVEQFAQGAAPAMDHNDRLSVITRAEFANEISGRWDFSAMAESLTRGIASCVAAYGLQNTGGPNDLRLPWPAPVALADYSDDSLYDDAPGPHLSGRLPNAVDDSSTAIGNPIGALLANCDPAVASDWTPALLPVWQHWKDHVFYTVAESFEPGAAIPSSCVSCLTVNGSGSYAALVFFAGSRLTALDQQRNAPPTDTDTRQDIANYLEDANSTNHPYVSGAADFRSNPPSTTFNDIVVCIDATLSVSSC